MKQNIMRVVALAGVASCSLCAHAGFFDAVKGVAAGAADVVGSAANSVLSVATNQSVLSVQASTGAVETATAEQADAEQRMAMEQRNARKHKNENERLSQSDKNRVRRGRCSLARGQTSGKSGSSWRQKLIDYGYDAKEVDRLDEKIRFIEVFSGGGLSRRNELRSVGLSLPNVRSFACPIRLKRALIGVFG